MADANGPAASVEQPAVARRGPDGLLSIEGAQALIGDHIVALADEPVALADAHGRFVARDVRRAWRF